MADAQASLDDMQNVTDDAASGVSDSADQDGPNSGGNSGGTEGVLDVAMTDSGLGVTELEPELSSGIDRLGDVELDVMVELGRTQMLVEDVLRLADGSVVELDKLAGDPVDVYVNGRLVARGEVLVLNDNFCIRVSEIVDDLEEQVQAAVQQVADQKVASTGGAGE